MPILHPSALPKAVGTPLLEVADRIAQLEPWDFFSDVDLIGIRDDTTGELRVACILGGLGEVFGVLLHRHDAGLRNLFETLNGIEGGFEAKLEDLDYLKVEWDTKKGLSPADRETLRLAGRTVKAGERYPRFEASQPGWHPWGLNHEEAGQLASDLRKVLRIIHLRQRVPDLFPPGPPFQIAVVPPGDESALQRENLHWETLSPKPRPALEPIQFTDHYLDQFRGAPQHEDLIVQFLAPLLPETSFIDEKAKRPCFSRLGILVDPRRGIIAHQFGHGADPLWHCAAQCLEKMFYTLGERPAAIQVDRPQFADMMAPACSPLGIRVDVREELPEAEHAYSSLIEGLGERQPE